MTMASNRGTRSDRIAKSFQPMQVTRLEIEPNRMLTTTDVHRTVGGEKAKPVGFLVGIDALEEVAPYPARVISRARKAKPKLADLMLDGSPCSAQNTGNVITRDRFVGVEQAQQCLISSRPGAKYLTSKAKFMSFVLDCSPIALEIFHHFFMRKDRVGIHV